MAKKSWTLTDVENNINVDSISIGPSDVEGAADGYSVKKHVLRGGRRDGVEVIHVDTGTISYVVLPQRGMGIWKAWHGGTEIGWQSPLKGPIHPQWVPVFDPAGLGWLEGFDELLTRCGLTSNGAPDFDEAGRLIYPLHGRVSNLPAHKVEVEIDGDTGQITVTGVVDESRFHFQKLRMTSTIKTTPGEPAIKIRDEVQNISGNPSEMQILYHVNFGAPILVPGSKVTAAVEEMTPRDARAAAGVAAWDIYGPEEPGSTEQVYFFKLLSADDGATQVVLKNPAGDLGINLKFNTAQLPCFTIWKNTPAKADGYVTGLEPGTNFPNPRTFETEQGRVVNLAPGETVAFDLQIESLPDAASVTAAEHAVAALQSGVAAKIHPQPIPGWTA